MHERTDNNTSCEIAGSLWEDTEALAKCIIAELLHAVGQNILQYQINALQST